jgi:CheY-like chemotaxis protein
MQDYVERNFREVAQDKGLDFEVILEPTLPPSIYTDNQRLQQVVRNLLSNAMKFTDEGSVTLRMYTAEEGWKRDQVILNQSPQVIAIEVKDTGIGIPVNRQRLVFEPFQQGDGSTSRKYGGTGLGLSISRDIAMLLGGEIRLESRPGEGSTFTLFLPQQYVHTQLAAAPVSTPVPARRDPAGPDVPDGPDAPEGVQPPTDLGNGEGAGNESRMLRTVATRSRESLRGAAVASTVTGPAADPALLLPGDVSDDRSDIEPDDQVVLIVEDDAGFARVLLDRAREKGFKGIVAATGEAVPVLARRYRPNAITLDIGLPDVDGWTVLDRLKHNPETRHIPVHIISGTEDTIRGLKQGAIAFLHKPATKEALDQAFNDIRGFVDRTVKRLLVVEDDEVQQQAIMDLIGNGDVKTTAVGTGAQALEALRQEPFDCMVIDLGLPDMSGFALMEQIRKDESLKEIPIIIYTGKDLTKKQETELRKLADTIIVKDVKSPERLLDETTLFLHRVQANLPPTKREMLDKARQADPILTGKKVLICDDDIRNIFALTSLLENQHMEVVYAENGKDAIDLLVNTPHVDVVLMDVVMPEMDGYETMRAIRKRAKFRSLPIIALTAKAMKGDRDQCIEAGASDYIAKPVDSEQLLSLLRVWLYKR